VSAYLAERLTAVSPVTVRVQLHSLRAFYAFCRAQGWRRDDPTDGIHIKRPKTQPKRPYTIEQSRALLAACLNPRDRALLLVLADTGIRISELLRMESEDVDWAEGTALIHGKGAKERYVLLGHTALGALCRCVNSQNGHLWLTRRGTPLKRAAARDMLRCVGRRAGVCPVGSHRFRITYANQFLETGGDIGALQIAMGHADIKETCHYAGYSASIRALEHQRRFSLGDRLTA
jgi:site-specific recombinase XerD